MPVGSAGSESFFDKYTKYTKDGKLNETEYQDLKRSYMTENNATEEQFNGTVAPALDSFIFENSTSAGAKELIAQALSDGKLTYDEYKNIKDYYMDSLGVSGEVFDSALDYIIRKDIVDYLKSNKEAEIEITNFKSKDKSIEEALEESIQNAIVRSLANDLVKMRTEDDFSEYTFRVLKAENNKTSEQAEEE